MKKNIEYQTWVKQGRLHLDLHYLLIKVGCVSTIKKNEILFVLSSICTTFR